MKTSIKTKKGFTIVELVIVIAVIAILAAVLIPTFANLVEKANEAAALADARNMANQLLINLLEHDAEGAKDLLVIQKKNDGIYVHAYSASEGRVVAYKNNPVSIEELKLLAATPEAAAEDGETAEPTEAEQYAEIVETLLLKLQDEAAIQLNADQPADDDWSHPNQMTTIVETLGYNNAETAFRANYTVLLPAFENAQVDPDHVCGELIHYEAQDSDCTQAGWKEYYMCPGCGKLFSDAEGQTPIDSIEIDPMKAHSWNEGEVTTDATCTEEGVKTYTCSSCGATKTEAIAKADHQYGSYQHDANNHWRECTVCHKKSGKAEHTLGNYYKDGDKYYSVCATCGTKTECNNLDETYKLAMDLNEILAKSNTKHATLYDAFADIVKNSSYSKIGEVTEAIFKVNDTLPNGKKIVWDQTIDRFSVVDDNEGKTVEVLYTADSEKGLSGTLTYGKDNTWRLWSIYDSKHQIPTANGLSLKHVYSIYWADKDSKPNPTYNGNYSFIAGFDVGEWAGDAEYQVQINVINTTENTNCIIRTNDKTDLVMQSAVRSDFYGAIKKLNMRAYVNDESDWYVYATITEVYLTYSNNIPQDIGAKATTIHAMQGSEFTQSKETIENLGYKVNEEGGTFGN